MPSPSPSPAPNDNPDIDGLSQWAYDNGQDPIDYAASTVYIAFEAWMHVRIGRERDPESFPGYGPDATLKNLSLRIIGRLLDAGWTAPVITPESISEETP
jgi:hypothetical protein